MSASYNSGNQRANVVHVAEQPARRASSATFAASFSEKAIRHAFIRKVYLILSSQLLVTAAVTCVFLFVQPVKDWVQTYWWMYILALVVYIVCVIAIFCCRSVARRFPANFICLGILTLAFSYVCGTITSYYDTQSVLIALAITVAVCVAISIFAVQVRFDFTMCGGLLFALTICVIMFGIACLIVYAVSGPNFILQCVYGGVAALLFSLWLVFDTQMIFGGRSQELSPEEYITGALALYIDVCSLFLIILGFSGLIN